MKTVECPLQTKTFVAKYVRIFEQSTADEIGEAVEELDPHRERGAACVPVLGPERRNADKVITSGEICSATEWKATKQP